MGLWLAQDDTGGNEMALDMNQVMNNGMTRGEVIALSYEMEETLQAAIDADNAFWMANEFGMTNREFVAARAPYLAEKARAEQAIDDLFAAAGM